MHELLKGLQVITSIRAAQPPRSPLTRANVFSEQPLEALRNNFTHPFALAML
jgi:hypothetical protein